MTDLELEAKLTALKQASTRSPEQVLDYRRIIYAQAFNEKDTRLSKKLMRRSLIAGVSSVHKTSIKIFKAPSTQATNTCYGGWSKSVEENGPYPRPNSYGVAEVDEERMKV